MQRNRASAKSRPGFAALLAEAYNQVGQPELYRLHGELILQAAGCGPLCDTATLAGTSQSPQEQAETCFLQAREVACHQQAKSLELRAAMSLSRLWQRQSKREAARALLEEVYTWFTEGFATQDLQDTTAQAEIDFLTQELAHAVGLGGRARKAGSPAERARVNVTRAIKAAVTRITTRHPALGHYLTRTITTGYRCTYTPDPHLLLSWEF